MRTSIVITSITLIALHGPELVTGHVLPVEGGMHLAP